MKIIDFIQNNIEEVESILRILLHGSIEIKSLQEIKIMPLENAEILTIDNVILALTEHFTFDYKTHGGAKLPVLAFYSIYSCLIKEVARYRNKTLRDLGSHTASDRTSNSAGDIEVFNENYPSEILDVLGIRFEKAVTIFSTAVYVYSKENIIFYGTKIHPKLLSRFGRIEYE